MVGYRRFNERIVMTVKDVMAIRFRHFLRMQRASYGTNPIQVRTSPIMNSKKKIVRGYRELVRVRPIP